MNLWMFAIASALIAFSIIQFRSMPMPWQKERWDHWVYVGLLFGLAVASSLNFLYPSPEFSLGRSVAFLLLYCLFLFFQISEKRPASCPKGNGWLVSFDDEHYVEAGETLNYGVFGKTRQMLGLVHFVEARVTSRINSWGNSKQLTLIFDFDITRHASTAAIDIVNSEYHRLHEYCNKLMNDFTDKEVIVEALSDYIVYLNHNYRQLFALKELKAALGTLVADFDFKFPGLFTTERLDISTEPS